MPASLLLWFGQGLYESRLSDDRISFLATAIVPIISFSLFPHSQIWYSTALSNFYHPRQAVLLRCHPSGFHYMVDIDKDVPFLNGLELYEFLHVFVF